MRSGWLRGSIYWVLLVWGRFDVTKTIISAAPEHFLTPSARRDTHLFGGLGLIRKLNERYENQNWVHYTWISAHCCNDWRNRATYAYTVGAQSGADKPGIAVRFMEHFNFYGWETGYSPSSPHVALWEYQPEGTAGTHKRLDWRFASEIRPWYSNHNVTIGAMPIPDCSVYYFGGTANIAVDWEGQYESWRDSN